MRAASASVDRPLCRAMLINRGSAAILASHRFYAPSSLLYPAFALARSILATLPLSRRSPATAGRRRIPQLITDHLPATP